MAINFSRNGDCIYPIPVDLDPYREEVLRYTVLAYGFLLPHNNTWITFAQFADRIAEVYSQENPRNAEVVRVLRSIPEVSLP